MDRSLGKKVIAQALRDLGETVEIHDDHFSPDAKDEDWLLEVGRRGWVVLTKDDRIRYRITEQTALRKARVRAFVLTSSQLQGKEMAQAFLKALPRMKRLLIKLYRTRGLNPRVRPNGRAAASPLWKPHRFCARLKRRGLHGNEVSRAVYFKGYEGRQRVDFVVAVPPAAGRPLQVLIFPPKRRSRQRLDPGPEPLPRFLSGAIRAPLKTHPITPADSL
ncbi:MAG: hypothetical protein HY694_17490 [Deltaproteobacteria bacterium]|nr:hypothetical protein [Deltaproteobacteria bacterium]